MKISITAEQKKQTPPMVRMGLSPHSPKTTPPRAGPSRLARVATMLITALPWASRPGGSSRGRLAWTAGW